MKNFVFCLYKLTFSGRGGKEEEKRKTAEWSNLTLIKNKLYILLEGNLMSWTRKDRGGLEVCESRDVWGQTGQNFFIFIGMEVRGPVPLLMVLSLGC